MRGARAGGFTAVELVVVLLMVVLLIVIVPLAVLYSRTTARSMQSMTQLRGIHQGVVIRSMSSKSGGGDGWYPGLTGGGETIATSRPHLRIGSLAFGNHNPIEAYADEEREDLKPDEMAPSPDRGLILYVFAELLNSDVTPYGGPSYFLSPADDERVEFVPGGGPGPGEFTLRNISYTIADVSDPDYHKEWRETGNPDAIVLADRAIGDGTDPTTVSSVWTRRGSGDWRGHLARNDGTVSYETTTRMEGLKYGDRTFGRDVVNNLFAARDDAETTTPEIDSGQGVLFDSGAENADEPWAF